MWQALMDWLPDVHIGTFEIRDLANLIVATVGLVLAGYAVRMGREQGRIAKRQAEIAERQDALIREQLENRPLVRVMIGGQTRSDLEPETDTIVQLVIKNLGRGVADG